MTEERILDLAADVLATEQRALSSLAGQLGPSLPQAVDILLNCRGHVIVSGSGTSHAVALRFAHLLSCVGTPAFFLHPGDSQHGAAGAVRAGDVWIGLSKGGETAEVCYLAGVAKKRGATVIAITENAQSTLGQSADLVLQAKAPEGVDPFGMVATGSSLFNSALCDVICVALLQLRGYTLQQFGETHPGGAVGKKLKGIF